MSERYKTPCALPTAYERELLTILIEECSEVQKRATKLLRFGRDEVQPGQPLTNMQRLSMEAGDLRFMMVLLQDVDLLDNEFVAQGMRNKRAQLMKYMQTDLAT